MNLILGFACFGIAWLCGWVADELHRRLPVRLAGTPAASHLRDAVAIVWFAFWFIAAGHFFNA